jgi:hypothetical protein
MAFEQANNSTERCGAREPRDRSNTAHQPDNDWAGEPVEGSGFEEETPEPGFEWRE